MREEKKKRKETRQRRIMEMRNRKKKESVQKLKNEIGGGRNTGSEGILQGRGDQDKGGGEESASNITWEKKGEKEQEKSRNAGGV